MSSQSSSKRPLRIVIGAVMYPPMVSGAANFAYRLATGLAQHGHDVHVVCHSTDREAHTTVAEGVTVHWVGSVGTPMHPEMRIMSPWRASKSGDQLLAEIQPDVVHVQSHFYLGRGLINAARRRGIPLVATNHFMPENIFGHLRMPRFLHHAAARLLWRNVVKHYSKAQMVTAPTPRAVQLLRENGFEAAAIPVSCGIDVHRYRRRAEAYRRKHPDPEVRTVLFVGRLDDEKHIEDLLRAMSLLHTKAPTRLEIVGEGSRREAFEQLATELGIRERVHFAGFVKDEELLECYARADAFCMPSIAELQSLATMEAMSARTPVVLANAMALPHLVKQGENGALYPPRDVHALASAIDDIVCDRTTIDRMGAASERLVLKHDINAVLAQFQDVYHRVINSSEQREVAEIDSELAS